MTGRDSLGRFTAGNTIARLGWQGLVARRFGGDELAARAWVGQVGRWAYGLNYRRADGEYLPWVKQAFRAHPGQPEEFTQRMNQALNFTLDELPEMEY